MWYKWCCGSLCRPLFELKGRAECLASALRAMAVALGRTASMRAARAMSPATPLKQLKYAMRGMAKSFEILWKWVVLAEFQRPAFTNTHGQGTDTARHTTYVNVQGRIDLRRLRFGRERNRRCPHRQKRPALFLLL